MNIIKNFESIKNKKYTRRILNSVFILIFVLYILLTIKKEYSGIQSIFFEIKWNYLIVSILILIINFFLFGISWNLILSMETNKIGFLNNFEFFAKNQLANLLPTPIPFLSSRFIFYKSYFTTTKILFFTFLEISFHFLSGLFLLSVIFSYYHNNYIFLVGATPLIFILFFHISIDKKEKFVIKIRKNINKIKYFIITFINLFTWVLSGIYFFSILKSLNSYITLDLFTIYIIWISSNLISYLGSYTIGLSGLFREFSMSIILQLYISASYSIIIPIFSKLILLFGYLLSASIILLFTFVLRKTK
jgi:hypothetical protein